LAPPPQTPSREPAGRSGDTSIDIAAELGLSAALTLDQLTSRWRDFVWRNHPDRQPVAAREGANARMAIANALYDRARRELTKARFGLALEWTDEPTDPAPPPQTPPREPVGRSGETSAEITAELGLSAALTLDQLTSRWRDFVWRNHPDRQPVAARERANRRVAIANTLYDRARRERDKVR
jgi:curved DNA-binding protein CbpA